LRRGRFRALPVAWMGGAPTAIALSVGLPAEVVAIGRLGAPASLTGAFTGASTERRGAEALTRAIAIVWSEQLLAFQAVTATARAAHDTL